MLRASEHGEAGVMQACARHDANTDAVTSIGNCRERRDLEIKSPAQLHNTLSPLGPDSMLQ